MNERNKDAFVEEPCNCNSFKGYMEVLTRLKGAAVIAGWERTYDWQKAIDHLAARAKQADELEDTLRGLASYVGTGGNNPDKLDPANFDERIRWGIDHLIKSEVTRQRVIPIPREPVKP